jgi:hypothetical protein
VRKQSDPSLSQSSSERSKLAPLGTEAGIEPLVVIPMMNVVADLEEGLTMEVALPEPLNRLEDMSLKDLG